MSRRALSPLMEVRETSHGDRPWSIGSELSGHCETEAHARDGRLSPGHHHRSYSQSSDAIDIHDGTNLMHNKPSNSDGTVEAATRPFWCDECTGISGARSGGRCPSATHGRDVALDTGDGQNQEPIALTADGYLVPPREQPQLIRASTTLYDRTVTDWWWWELLSWLVSFFSIAAIVIVLIMYDDQPLDKWPLPIITLNAYISILAAVAKAALILPVSEALGQLKWTWFRRSRRLHDFYTFDSASRGPWGSVMLLASTKFRHLASLGAAITLLSLAFEPFFQQIVTFPARHIVTGNGTVAISSSYDVPLDRLFGTPDLDNDPLMAVTIKAAAVGGNDTARAAPSSCSSGNCTWSEYSSLGLCSQCKRLEDVLQWSCTNHTKLNFTNGQTTTSGCGHTLNNTLMTGTDINGIGGKTAITFTTLAVDAREVESGQIAPVFQSTLYTDIAYPVLDLYLAYVPGGVDALIRNDTPVLMECLYSWCAKSYSASYAEGVLNETILSVLTNHSGKVLTKEEIDAGVQPVLINPSDGEMTFTVANGTTEALRQGLLTLLSTTEWDQDMNGTELGLADPQIVTNFNKFWESVPYDVTPFMDSIATAVTNEMRSKVDGTAYVLGPAWGTETFVKIRWEWISLPAFLLIISFIFVAATIIKSSRHKATAWKSSALFMLLHGLGGEIRQRFDPDASPSEVEAAARKITVILRPDKDTARLVLAQHENVSWKDRT